MEMETKGRKLKLDVEELEVESFTSSLQDAWNGGTVRAHLSIWSCWDTDYDCPSVAASDCSDCSDSMCDWCPRPSLRAGNNFECVSYDIYC